MCRCIFRFYSTIHLYWDHRSRETHFIAVRFSFVFLSSSYRLANLISNKIICSICGCFYIRTIRNCWPENAQCISLLFIKAMQSRSSCRSSYFTALHATATVDMEKKWCVCNAEIRAQKFKRNSCSKHKEIGIRQHSYGSTWFAFIGVSAQSINPSHM